MLMGMMTLSPVLRVDGLGMMEVAGFGGARRTNVQQGTKEACHAHALQDKKMSGVKSMQGKLSMEFAIL